MKSIFQIAIGWALAALLTGCATPADAPLQPVSRPQTVPPSAPQPLTSELTQRIQAAVAARLSLSSADLAASTHIEPLLGWNTDKPVYLSRTEGSHCVAGNCAYGLFLEEGGQLRELYFAWLASAPRVMSERHLGFADLTAKSLVDDTRFRSIRLRWDGENFVETSCSLISRVTEASQPCAAIAHTQIVTESYIPPSLCEQVKTMLSRPLNRIQTQTMMKNSFLVRGDADNHVEAIKVRGNVMASAKRLLIACVRSRGTAELLDVAQPRFNAGDRSTDVVRFRVRGAEINAVDLTFGLAYFKRGETTLLTFGVSAVKFTPR